MEISESDRLETLDEQEEIGYVNYSLESLSSQTNEQSVGDEITPELDVDHGKSDQMLEIVVVKARTDNKFVN